MLIGHELAELWSQLLLHQRLQVARDCISNLTLKKTFKSVCNLGHNISMDMDAQVVLWKIDIYAWNIKCRNGLAIRQLLRGYPDCGSKSDMAHINTNRPGTFKNPNLIIEVARVKIGPKISDLELNTIVGNII